MHLSELINNNYVLSCQLNYVHNIIESDCNLSELFEMFFLRHSVDDSRSYCFISIHRKGVLIIVYTTVCPEKKRPKCFFVISPVKLRRFRWNLVHSFRNKFAAKSFRSFPPHLNNVSTLPCETWNALYACVCMELLSDTDSSIFSTLTVASKFARFESRWLQSVGNIAREVVQKCSSVIWMNWNSDRERSVPSWIMSSL